MATTMKDVARRAGVDVSTVSLAINNDPRIRTQTREKILSIAQELGYRKNHLARGLRSGKSYTVGAVVAPDDRAWGEMLTGAQAVFAEHEYHLLLDIAATPARREETQVEALRAKRVDGLLIAPMEGETVEMDTQVALYQSLHGLTPVVLMERTVPQAVADTVTVDNRAAGRLAAEHLLSQGHRKIAFLQAPHRNSTAIEARRQGYEDAMADAGQTPLFWEVVVAGAEPVEEGHAAVQSRLAESGAARVTGIIGASDTLAVGAVKALADVGRTIPDDVAVVSFGGAATRDLFPMLTIVSLPLAEIGRQAAALLLRRIEGDTSPVQHIVLPPVVRVGKTCGALFTK